MKKVTAKAVNAAVAKIEYEEALENRVQEILALKAQIKSKRRAAKANVKAARANRKQVKKLQRQIAKIADGRKRVRDCSTFATPRSFLLALLFLLTGTIGIVMLLALIWKGGLL